MMMKLKKPSIKRWYDVTPGEVLVPTYSKGLMLIVSVEFELDYEPKHGDVWITMVDVEGNVARTFMFKRHASSPCHPNVFDIEEKSEKKKKR